MRVAAINRSIYNRTTFRGLFQNTPNISDKFRFGLEALDNNSILTVTSNSESSDMMLELYSDKIDIPILKKYTLKVTPSDLKNQNELKANFAIFKKNDGYYVLNIGNTFDLLVVKNPKREFNSQKDMFKPGEITKLEEGSIIETGESVYSYKGEKDKFIFKKPCYNPERAEKYLEVKSSVENPTQIHEFNKRTIAAMSELRPKITTKQEFRFCDIGGLDDVIEKLKQYVVRPINYPQVYNNIRLNKGILLYGPSRCGKTLLGKALANECNAKYIECNANELKTGEVGGSESRIRKLFKQAIADAPSITFIDELDSIAKKRDGSSNARFDDAMVNQLLGCMSDLEKTKVPAFIVAATNMKSLIDKALLATGRFGLHLEIPMPNLEGIKQIFKIHSKNQPIEESTPISEIIKKMFDNKFNGSDVAETVTDSYFNALERMGMNKKMDAKTFCYNDLKEIMINKDDLLKAVERIVKQKL